MQSRNRLLHSACLARHNSRRLRLDSVSISRISGLFRELSRLQLRTLGKHLVLDLIFFYFFGFGVPLLATFISFPVSKYRSSRLSHAGFEPTSYPWNISNFQNIFDAFLNDQRQRSVIELTIKQNCNILMADYSYRLFKIK